MNRCIALLLCLMALNAWASASKSSSTTTTKPAASQSTSKPSAFLPMAREVAQHIQKNYYDPKTGLYIHSLKDRRSEAMWGNGVMFSALVGAAKHEPRVYRPIMNRFFAAMDRYWDARAKIPGYEPWPTRGGGNDKYYDDNQWMVISFLEAYDLTGDARYLARADQTLRFSLSGWDDQLGGGIWWHEQHKDGSKNTCSNAPAAVACLRMAEYRRRDENIAWARKIVAWTNVHLQDKDGLFFDNKKVATSAINRDKLTYNTGLMLRANLGLFRLTGEKQFLDEAKRIGSGCDWFVGKDGAYRDNIKFAHLLVEADLEFHRATGDARALARASRNGQVVYEKWKSNPPQELIEQASIARTLWLLVD
jgi:hypothetical protein